MSRTNDQLQEDLAKQIFKKLPNQLSIDELFFVNAHRMNYTKYRAEVAKRAREVMKVQRLSSPNYTLIFEWYCRKIPVYCVLQGINEMEKWCEGREDKSINSLAYCDKAVNRANGARIRSKFGNDWTNGGIDPWMFHAWTSWKNKKEFDLLTGPQ